MELTTNPKVWKFLTVLVILLTIVFLTLFYFSRIFITIVVGIIMIIFTERVMQFYHKYIKKMPLSKWQGKFIGYFFLILILLFVFSGIGTSVGGLLESIDQSQQIKERPFQEHISTFTELFPPIINERLLDPELYSYFESHVISLFSSFLSQFTFFLINSLLIIPLLFYMYFNKRKMINEKIKGLIPKKFENGFNHASNTISKQMYNFLSAKTMESVVISLICWIGFYIAGLPGWFVLGLIAGFLNIIPFIGPLVGAIPPILVSLFYSPIMSLYVIITIVIAQLIDNFYIIPFFITSKVKVDSLWGIILILIGAQLFGLMGMVFAIPIYIIYKIILLEAYIELVKVFDRKDI